MKRYSSATKLTNKKSYLEYMADEKSKRKPSLSFLSGFTRNMATKHTEQKRLRQQTVARQPPASRGKSPSCAGRRQNAGTAFESAT